jgi:hypothetical protein
MNGTHDNATHYGGSGLLRDDERMCNFCREISAYRVYSRAGILGDDAAGFATWKSAYRSKFFERFPFAVPALVPQTNNVQNPNQGMAYYETCQAAHQLSSAPPPRPVSPVTASSSPRHGCIVEP